MTEEIHDFSRVDAYAKTRQRVSLLNASWKPALAGAVGAALMMGCVWIILPKVSHREIEVPRVTMRDTTVPNIVTKDVPFDNHVPAEKPFDLPVPQPKPFDNYIPHVVTTETPPSAPIAPPSMGPKAPYAAVTPDENKFVDTPDYKKAVYHGRIVRSIDGVALSFADGANFWPFHWDDATNTPVPSEGRAFDSDQYIGNLGMCVPDKEHAELVRCSAMHDGQVVQINYKPRGQPA